MPDILLSPDQLSEVFQLIAKSDSVELKLTVPAADRWRTMTSMDMDPLDAQIRQVVFFDTPTLALNEAGVVLRARRVQKRAGDSVVKLRPIDPDELATDLRKMPGFGVELDAMPGGYVCSGSLRGVCKDADIKDVLAGKSKPSTLFSQPQRDLIAAHMPAGVTLDELAVLGPITVFKLKFQPMELTRRMVAEMWFYPDGSRILELSTKALPSEAFQAAAETRHYLTSHGVQTTDDEQTKTKTALEFFTRQ